MTAATRAAAIVALALVAAGALQAETGTRTFDAITDIAVSPANEIWVATSHGIAIADAAGRMRPAPQTPREFCHRVGFTADGRPWIQCGVAGLAIRNESSWTAVRLPAQGASIADVAFDDRDRPWVATNLGLFVETGGKWSEVSLPRSGSLRWTAVSCVAVHPRGFVLAQVLLHGLVKIDAGTLAHETVVANADGGCPLRLDPAGNAWFVTPGGVHRIEAGGLRAPAASATRVAEFHALDLAFDQRGRPWLSTRRGGIHAFDGERWAIVVPERTGRRDERYGRYPLAFDQQGNLWTGGAIVPYFRPARGTSLVRIPADALPPGR